MPLRVVVETPIWFYFWSLYTHHITYPHYIPGWWFGCHFLFSHQYWVSNHPHWRSYFSEGWPNHQPEKVAGVAQLPDPAICCLVSRSTLFRCLPRTRKIPCQLVRLAEDELAASSTQDSLRTYGYIWSFSCLVKNFTCPPEIKHGKWTIHGSLSLGKSSN